MWAWYGQVDLVSLGSFPKSSIMVIRLDYTGGKIMVMAKNSHKVSDGGEFLAAAEEDGARTIWLTSKNATASSPDKQEENILEMTRALGLCILGLRVPCSLTDQRR